MPAVCGCWGPSTRAGGAGLAEDCLRKAARPGRAVGRGADSPDWQESVLALAALYQNLGDAAKAEGFRKQLPPPAKPRDKAAERLVRDRALSEQAQELFRRGEYVRALPLYEQLAAKSQASLGETSVTYYSTLWGLGMCYQALGEYGEAEPVLRRASELSARGYGKQTAVHALSLGLLGDLHNSLDEPREAEDFYRLAVRMADGTGTFQDGLARYYHGKIGLLHLRLGKSAQALPELSSAFRADLGELQTTLPGLSEGEALAFLGYPNLWAGRDACLEAFRDRPQSAAEAYRLIWQTRGLLQQYLAGRRLRVRESPQAAALFGELQSVRRKLAEGVYAPLQPGKEKAQCARRSISSTSARRNWRRNWNG